MSQFHNTPADFDESFDTLFTSIVGENRLEQMEIDLTNKNNRVVYCTGRGRFLQFDFQSAGDEGLVLVLAQFIIFNKDGIRAKTKPEDILPELLFDGENFHNAMQTFNGYVIDTGYQPARNLSAIAIMQKIWRYNQQDMSKFERHNWKFGDVNSNATNHMREYRQIFNDKKLTPKQKFSAIDGNYHTHLTITPIRAENNKRLVMSHLPELTAGDETE